MKINHSMATDFSHILDLIDPGLEYQTKTGGGSTLEKIVSGFNQKTRIRIQNSAYQQISPRNESIEFKLDLYHCFGSSFFLPS